jgi:hypothetical protein
VIECDPQTCAVPSAGWTTISWPSDHATSCATLAAPSRQTTPAHQSRLLPHDRFGSIQLPAAAWRQRRGCTTSDRAAAGARQRAPVAVQ